MIAKIEQLLKEVEALHASNAEELEALRIKYLSKKGAINDLMADFRNVAAEQKKEVGMRLNELKNKAQEKINALKEQFESQDTGCDDIDLTRSAYPVELGTRHPLTIVKNEIIDIFARLGFSIAEGPEIEDDWHVFSALNFAEDHPARDMQDTFFIEAHPDIVLRTHTSSVQTRVMEVSQPPIRIICPGRVYRNEAISYRAHCFFHQVEALYVDKDVSFTDLKQVLLLFAKEMFGEDTKIRLRGKGVPSWRNKDVRGDHYVTLVVQTPDKLKPEAKELLKQFDALTGDSLNAVKKATESGEGETRENDSRDGKKKKFWK